MFVTLTRRHGLRHFSASHCRSAERSAIRDFIMNHVSSSSPLIPKVEDSELTPERIDTLCALVALKPSSKVIESLKEREGWITMLLNSSDNQHSNEHNSLGESNEGEAFHSFRSSLSLTDFEKMKQTAELVEHSELMRLATETKDGFFVR